MVPETVAARPGGRGGSRPGGGGGHLRLVSLLPEQVRGPVDEVEEREHEREGDAGDDVNPLGARGELGEPRLAAVGPALLHVYLALPHLHHRESQSWISRHDDGNLIRSINVVLHANCH